VSCARLAAAFAEAIAAFDLAARVREGVRGVREDAGVLAIGKAAPAMMRGALDALARARGLVIAPDGTPCDLDASRVEVLRAAHPVPDARSVEAAERALAFVAAAPFSVILVSGGASALVCAPHADGSLQVKRDVTRALLASGASIAEMNVVRRHLSRIKGGGLANAARDSLALVVSDVLGDALHDIGSGPTVADPTTVADARAVLAHHTPAYGAIALHETAKQVRGETRLIASPGAFAEALAQALGARVLAPSSASVDDLARAYAALARSLGPGEAVVRSAEPSLAVPPHAGRGGRCAHLAARVALDLPPGVAFLAGATDGIDGASDAAGACVDAASFPDPRRVLAALAAFDTATLHAASGTALRSGPTGLNFTDVHVLART